jgi:hypothetical protein
VGLLAGALIGFSIQHPVESPFAIADAQAVTELRAQAADIKSRRSDLKYWLPLCKGHSPLCTAYIAGIVQANTLLHPPEFCPKDLLLADVEGLLTEALRWVEEQKPHLLSHTMPAFILDVLNDFLPCETKPAHASGSQTARKP